MSYIMFCDMDGCLCDFVKGYKELTGDDLTGIHKHITDWSDVDSHPNFWSSLDWMPDGKVLWAYVSRYDPHILSSPSDSTTAEEQKEEWIQKNLKTNYSDIIFAQKDDKQNYAAPNHILIDDYEPTIIQWNNRGGIGILHVSASSTIQQLKELGL